jgi:hypothetical protein
MQESWEGWGGRASSSRSTMEVRENGRANADLRKGMNIYRPAQNQPVGDDLPQKFWPGGQKFRGLLKTEIPARGRNFRPPYKISAPLLRVAPQLEKKDLAKFRRGGNYGISGPPEISPSGALGRNFRPGRKHQYENGCNFCIRTPFSMILGSLESPQRALQLNP